MKDPTRPVIGPATQPSRWPESPSPQTAVGAVLGTAGYMSPEQARGRAVDYRSDQFTLGAILYEMATGRQAFQCETTAQTIAAVIDATPAPSLKGLSPAPGSSCSLLYHPKASFDKWEIVGENDGVTENDDPPWPTRTSLN